MKRFVSSVILFALIIFAFNCQAMDLSAHSAIVIEGEYGSVVYAKDAHTKRTMASTTKIMTAICAIEEGDLDKKVKIPPEAVGVEGSSMYLKAEEEFTLRELVYGLMLNSGNDAAVAIACVVSGSVDKFALLMNSKAKEIGALDTQFKNPNGLDEEGHYTTAYDLALITAYGLKNPEFKKIVSSYQYTINANDKRTARYLTNHNKLLKMYKDCIGVKTGFTKKSGRCLVSAANRNGVTLVAVTLNAPDDWKDHSKMLDFGFENVRCKTMVSSGEKLSVAAVDGGCKKTVKITAGKDFRIPALNKNKYITLFETPENLKAPLEEGEPVGEVKLYMGDKLIGTVPAVSAETVPEDKRRNFVSGAKSVVREFICFDK